MAEPEMDAWAQQAALTKRYTRTYERLADGLHRPELTVVADGLVRGVFLHGERHNVRTIRQYVDVLVQACAFVEEANPKWAEWAVSHPAASDG